MTLRVELLIIGNELLSGHTLDTNSQWLAQRLFDLDLPVNQILVIDDNVERIAHAITLSVERHTNLLITSGGLGPTFDDITAEGLASAAEVSLQLHPEALRMVTQRYQELKTQGLVESSDITPAREKMARLPNGAKPLPNSVGSAPGIYFTIAKTEVYCLPGVPQELYAIFMNAVTPLIAPLTEKVALQEIIQVPILDESHLAPLIDSVMQDTTGVYLKSLPHPYQSRKPLRVAITATAITKSQATIQLQEAINKLRKITHTHRQIELSLDD
jgi:molybdenum cofactor synthesis domain-containing protein